MSKSIFARFALGAVAGITIGYTAVRVRDMLLDHVSPAPAQERDAKRYGDGRRMLMVAGHVRAAAAGAMWAFGLADFFEKGLGWVPVPLRLPVFVALMTGIEAARETPIEYIEEYQLERIYGNSERTMEAWGADRLKATLIGGGVGTVLAFFAGALMRRAPKRWPWIAIAGMPALLAFANVVAPDVHHAAVQQIHPARGSARAAHSRTGRTLRRGRCDDPALRT